MEPSKKKRGPEQKKAEKETPMAPEKDDGDLDDLFKNLSKAKKQKQKVCLVSEANKKIIYPLTHCQLTVLSQNAGCGSYSGKGKIGKR